MGLEEQRPHGFLLATVEKVAGYARSRSVWRAAARLHAVAGDADLRLRAGRLEAVLADARSGASSVGTASAAAPVRRRVTLAAAASPDGRRRYE
jgi:hypothetical protein